MNKYILILGSVVMLVSGMLEPNPLPPQVSDGLLLFWIGLAVAAKQRGEL